MYNTGHTCRLKCLVLKTALYDSAENMGTAECESTLTLSTEAIKTPLIHVHQCFNKVNYLTRVPQGP